MILLDFNFFQVIITNQTSLQVLTILPYMKVRLFLSVFFISILLACSKGDHPVPPEEPIGTLQGVFIDSPVSGLRYETETHSGYTDENGKFDYEEGETVTFYVGDIKLGTAIATGEVSPIDIASTENATIETLEVQNIAAFLQTLDLDGDPSNGIVINDEVSDAISLSEIDFTQSIIQILGEMAIDVFQQTGIDLQVAYPEMAATHLAQSLGIDFEPEPSFTLNFLPTFMNYYSRECKAIYWVHEFDDEGRLLKSSKYEKYPFRIKQEFMFSDYDSNNLRITLEIKEYNYAYANRNSNSSKVIGYNQEFFIENIYFNGPIDNYTNRIEILEQNEEGWVLKEYKFSSGQIGTTPFEDEDYFTYEYNDSGLVTQRNILDENETIISTLQNTYTEFLDIKTSNTLEREEWLFNDPNRYHIIFEYNENEALLKDTTKFGDELQHTTIDTYDAGVQTLFEWYMDGIIYQISYFTPDGNGGSYHHKIENYGSDGVLDSISFYDSNGIKTDTVCYENGSEIECSN